MVDVLMIVFIVIIGLVLIASNVYILYYYCADDDAKQCSTFIAKGVAVIGMILAWAQVLMLPLDVSNARGEGGGIDMKLFWFIVYMASAIWIFVVIPFMKNYLEAEEDWSWWAKFKYSFCFFLATIIILILILIVLYAFIGTAYIPVTTKECSIKNLQSSSVTTVLIINDSNCITNKSDLILNVSFPIYVIGLISFLSWFLFTVFGGIGLAAIPLDLIRSFASRPKRNYTRTEIENMKYKLVQESRNFKENIEKFQNENSDGRAKKGFFFSKKKMEYNNQLNLFRINMMKIQNLRKELRLNYLMSGENSNILYYIFLLILGILASIISLVWILQIIFTFVILKNGNPVVPFLNSLLTLLTENNVSFIAFFIFAILCIYLLWAAVKGSIKFGLRLVFCWRIYPMEPKKTYMNTILFNVGLILFTSFSVTQFCAAAFDEYVTFTDIQLIFSVQIRYLVFFVYFYRYHVFEYILLAFALFAFIYLCCTKDTERMDKLEEIAGSDQSVPIR